MECCTNPAMTMYTCQVETKEKVTWKTWFKNWRSFTISGAEQMVNFK